MNLASASPSDPEERFIVNVRHLFCARCSTFINCSTGDYNLTSHVGKKKGEEARREKAAALVAFEPARSMQTFLRFDRVQVASDEPVAESAGSSLAAPLNSAGSITSASVNIQQTDIVQVASATVADIVPQRQQASSSESGEADACSR